MELTVDDALVAQSSPCEAAARPSAALPPPAPAALSRKRKQVSLNSLPLHSSLGPVVLSVTPGWSWLPAPPHRTLNRASALLPEPVRAARPPPQRRQDSQQPPPQPPAPVRAPSDRFSRSSAGREPRARTAKRPDSHPRSLRTSSASEAEHPPAGEHSRGHCVDCGDRAAAGESL